MSEGATRLGIALAAGCGATCCVHPLDVVRVNLQVDQPGARVYNGTLDCMRSIARRQGIFRGLYSGITAGIFRQITYGGPRMALYPMVVQAVLPPGEENLSLPSKFACGAAAGGVIGAQFGAGTGKLFMTAIGAGLGALVGGEIADELSEDKVKKKCVELGFEENTSEFQNCLDKLK